jgi:hypothetical protein
VACFQLEYSTSLIFNVASPVLLFLPLALSIVLGRYIWKHIRPGKMLRPVWHSLCSGLLVTTTLAYATMTAAALEVFYCQPIDGRNLLVASSYTVECDEFAWVRAVGVIGVILAISIPVLIAATLIWVGKYRREYLWSVDNQVIRNEYFTVFGFLCTF